MSVFLPDPFSLCVVTPQHVSCGDNSFIFIASLDIVVDGLFQISRQFLMEVADGAENVNGTRFCLLLKR